MYLVWVAYDTRRLWCIQDRLRLEISAFQSKAMRVVMEEDGYSELVRLLGLIDQERWDYVPENQSERGRESRTVVVYNSPGTSEKGAYYMYI